MRNRNPQDDGQITPSEGGRRKPGRPRGHKLSRESKVKIAEARQKQEQERRARDKEILPATFPAITDQMRRIVVERDGKKCRSCGDPGPKLAVHTFLNGLTDLNRINRDPSLSAVMCSFCRDVADTMEATSIDSMLRERW